MKIKICESNTNLVIQLKESNTSFNITTPTEKIEQIDYDKALNKPKINGVELIGNKSSADIGIGSLSNIEIENIIK